MAKQTESSPTPDGLAAMKKGIDDMKSRADQLGVAQWKQLRSIRRDISNLIKAIEETKS